MGPHARFSIEGILVLRGFTVLYRSLFCCFSLEIQKDENEALKAALQTTLKAKEEDMRMYSDTIEETKKVFLQALRQYKQTVHGT